MILKMQEADKEPSFFVVIGATLISDGKEIFYKTSLNENKKKNIEELMVVELLSDDGAGLIHKYK